MLKLEGPIKDIIHTIENSSDPREKRNILINAVKKLSKTPESLSLFYLYFDLLNKIEDAGEKKACLSEFIKEIPQTSDFRILYLKVIESTIDAASNMEDRKRSRLELFHILNEMPKTEDFIKLRIHALRLAMGLLEKPEHRKALLPEIAKELPKSSDDSFYRRYTLLGIANELPKTGGEYLNLYKDAIQLAIEAADFIEEPYYQEYALISIARELPKTGDYLTLYKLAVSGALNAATAIEDPLARKYALLDILKDLPKAPDFFNIFHEIIKQTLNFYSVRKRLENIDVIGRIDYFLAGEQKRITESKKAHYAKIKFAQSLAREIEEFGLHLNDIRLIETLKPYTHAWIQPPELRHTVKKIVDRMENLRDTYHGREIEQPIFIKEYHPLYQNGRYQARKNIHPRTSLSIDLGATNTVVMLRKGLEQPDFILLGPISKLYGKTYVIPTLLNPETNSIGAEAEGKSTVVNIKKMLLDGSPQSKEYMERYVRILYQHIKKAMGANGRFPLFSSNLADAVYITVPVGFYNYRKYMKDILERVIKGANIIFIEEPLASAIGYQVAEEQDKIIMLIDFGGCTLNTMMLRLNVNEIHVVSKPDRAKMLGGRDIDMWLAEYLAKKIGIQKENIPYQLILKAEDMKIALSEHRTAPFEWGKTEICKVSREGLEDILAQHDFYKIVDRTISNILKKSEKIGIKKDMIDAILLTGGSSQIPSFKEKLAHTFPILMGKNAIYDHDPLSATARGAALYGTRNIITDRHLAFAYAIRYTTKNTDAPYSYRLILEKGEAIPIEKTFKLTPAMTLGQQDEIYLELFEVPESLIERRWITESGVEFIKQEIKQIGDIALKDLKIITLSFKEPITEAVYAAFCVNEAGYLMVKYGKEMTELETGIRLQ